MSIAYNRLYKDNKWRESEQNLESLDSEAKGLKDSNAALKAVENIALQKIKYALSKLIVSRYAEGAIKGDSELCILENYFAIVNKKLKDFQIENPELFKIVSNLKSVIDIVDGEGSLNRKMQKVAEEFPEFLSALDKVRFLIEDEQVFRAERTEDYRYPDLFPSNYLLIKKIKECIAERRKIEHYLLSEITKDHPDDSLEQELEEKEKVTDYSEDYGGDRYDRSNLTDDMESRHEGSFEKSSDPLVKFLLITGIKKNLANNDENVENELRKLESTAGFKENLVLEVDDPESEQVEDLLDELRNKIINFKESKVCRLYRKAPALEIEEESSKSLTMPKWENDVHKAIRKFRNKKVHTEDEIDDFVESVHYKQLVEKMSGGKEILDYQERKRKRKYSDLVKVITKRLAEVGSDGSGKVELKELEEMGPEELVEMLSSIVDGKLEHVYTGSQYSLNKSVSFLVSKKDQKSILKRSRSVSFTGFPLSAKSSELLSKDSFLDPSPKKTKPIANSIQEMMAGLAIYEEQNKFKFFKPDSANDKVEKPPKTFLRSAKYSDLADLERLVNDQTRQIFGDKSLSHYFEYSNACIVQLTKDQQLVAFIAIQNDPSVPALPPSCWDIWIHDIYGMFDCTYTNTMFIRMLLWDERYEDSFLEPFLTYLYINTFMLKQIFLVKPPGVDCPRCIQKVFSKINPRKIANDNDFKCQLLYHNLRHNHIPTLKIRKTAEQDNIDIMPELNRVAPELGRVFGDYLISELVRFSTDHRIGLTAFANEKIVGYALLNTNVCVSNLNKYFEVAPFNGFYVHHEDDYFPIGRKVRMIEENYPILPERINNLLDYNDLSASNNEKDLSESIASFDVDSDLELYEGSDREENVSTVALRHSFVFTSDFAKRRPTRLINKNDLNFQASDKLKINLKPRLSKGILAHPHLFSRKFLLKEMEMNNPPPIKMNLDISEEAVYHGAPNVVMIEIFLMLKGFDFRLSYDFLEAIFEVINVDYCILSFPPSDPIPPIVDHFARLIPKTGTWFPHEVYVLHRSYILCPKTVRAANRNDFVKILQLTSNLVNYKKVRNDFLDSLFTIRTSFESYVLLCSDVIVGLCIIDKTLISCTKLEVQFDLEKYMGPSMYNNHANIKHCCIHPIFSTCSTILFREVIRLSTVSCLFYRLYEEDVINMDQHTPTIISCIGDLVPVIPRVPLQYHSELAKGKVITTSSSDFEHTNSGFFCSMVESEKEKKSEKFALFFMNTKVGSVLKRGIHLKIVIVGASGTALSFIESLIFRTEMEVIYTNIVLVSPSGLPCREKPHAARDAMKIFRGRYNRDFLTQLGVNAWINICYGYMTSIDRNKKFITINYDKKLNYDYLFLFTGQQFMKPIFHTCDEKFEANSSIFSGTERFTDNYVSDCPINMFMINSDVDASYSLLTIHKLLNDTHISNEAKFVVYGHMLEAFAVLNALTIFGIPTSRIAFVEPFPNEPAETLFNDTAVDEAVLSNLVKEGFTVYTPFYLTSWDFNKAENIIKKLHFQSFDSSVSIECFCLYAFDFKSTDLRTFIALMNSQLVYDGKLVIDNEFRTNDKYIYAAGPLTRYSSSYYSDDMDHEYYNSIEIGLQVHKRVAPMFDIRSSSDDVQDEPERRNSDECRSFANTTGLPQLFQPRVESCQLPGGWNYLRVIKPGKVLPLENQLSNKHPKGPTFVTGNCTDETGPGYFKLVLDHNKIVIEILCYTRQEIEIYNLIKLYGKHVAFFNNLEQRYNLGTVNDLYDYFRQPWAYAMYHDKFYFIEKKNKRLFYRTRPKNKPSKKFSDVVTDSLIENQWEDLGVSTIEELRKLMHKSTNLSEEIHANLKSFLVANELNLPMYINDEYIIVIKDETGKHHLHSAPPLGVNPKSLKLLSERLKNIPEGVTMQEFQKRYFKSKNETQDKSVNTDEQGFCITSYLSLHSGADTCDNCEQYRKLKSAEYGEEVMSSTKRYSYEKMSGAGRSFKDEWHEMEREKYLDSANMEMDEDDKTAIRVSQSSEILGDENSHRCGSKPLLNEKTSSEMFGEKLDEVRRSNGEAPSETNFDLQRISDSSRKLGSSLMNTQAEDIEKAVRTDSKVSQQYSDTTIDHQSKLPDSSSTGSIGKQTPSKVSNLDHTSSTEGPSAALKSGSDVEKELSHLQTTQSKKYPSSKTSISKRKSLGENSETQVLPHKIPSSKTSDLKKGSALSNELSSSQTQRLQKLMETKSPTNSRGESSTSKLDSGSIKQEGSNKDSLIEHQENFIEAKKFDSISQCSFSPLLLDDLLDHVTKIHNLDLSFEDVHNVRWKKVPAEYNLNDRYQHKKQTGIETGTQSHVGTSTPRMTAERMGNFSQKCNRYTSCRKDKEEVMKCPVKDAKPLRSKK